MLCHIITVDYGDGFDCAEEIFDIEGFEGVIDYLSGWDYGTENEYDDAMVENIPRNPYTDVYQSEYYVLVRYCGGLGFSLYRKIK